MIFSTRRPDASGRFQRRLAAGVAVLLAVAASLSAQAQAGAADATERVALDVEVFRFEHQRAEEAIDIIRPLFSAQGSVELRPSGDSVVLRERQPELGRILATLRDYDHPLQELTFRIQIVEARRAERFSPPRVGPGISKKLYEHLSLLSYGSYDSLAEATVEGSEGAALRHQFSQGFDISFDIGTVLNRRRLQLKEFRVVRRDSERPGSTLLHANLAVKLEETLAVVLLKDVSTDRALVIAVTAGDGRGDMANR